MFETRLWTTLVFVCALAVAAGCNHEKSRNPLSPSIAGPIEGVTIVPPGPMTTGDSLIPVADQPVTLVFSNATTNGERTVYYGVEIATDSGFTQIVHSASKIPADPLGQTSYQVPVTLDPEQTYYWRTRADDGANASEFSGPGTFEIYTPLSIKAPALVSPVSGTVLAGRKPTLVVDDTVISGPATDVRFRFELATDAGFANIVVVLDVAAEIAQVQAMNGRTSVGHDAALGPRGTVPGVGVNPANVSTGDLAWNTTHYWRARASAVGREGQVIGPWSATGSFVTGLEPVNIDAPTHVSPINGATAAANPPTFVVNNPAVSGQSGPITIHYHVATDSDFANVVSVFSAPMGSGPTTTAVSGSLADDTLFYWHMFATDGTTTGPWSHRPKLPNARTTAAATRRWWWWRLRWWRWRWRWGRQRRAGPEQGDLAASQRQRVAEDVDRHQHLDREPAHLHQPHEVGGVAGRLLGRRGDHGPKGTPGCSPTWAASGTAPPTSGCVRVRPARGSRPATSAPTSRSRR